MSRGAAHARATCPTNAQPPHFFYSLASPQKLVDDLMGKWVEEVTGAGAEVALARSRRAAAAQPPGADAALPVLSAEDVAAALGELFPSCLGDPSAKPWARAVSVPMPRAAVGAQQQPAAAGAGVSS